MPPKNKFTRDEIIQQLGIVRERFGWFDSSSLAERLQSDPKVIFRSDLKIWGSSFGCSGG